MRNLSNQDAYRPMDRLPVPEVVINRLPQYVRVLKSLLYEEVQVVNSQLLGRKLQVTPAQIRKDLSYFGRFGKQGRGYDVAMLEGQLRADGTFEAATLLTKCGSRYEAAPEDIEGNAG